MAKEDQAPISLSRARKALASVSRRVALLHLAYAKAIIRELGRERGTRIISEALKDYAAKIGEKTKHEVLAKGLEPTPENFGQGDTYNLPDFPGMHTGQEVVEVGGEKRFRAYDCILAEVWREYGEDELGRLYCYMDTAKFMGYNPHYKFVHLKAKPDGDEYCEFTIKSTTEQERSDFATEGKDWFYMDK